MRLKDKEVKIIKTTISDFFSDAKIYLFGSRVFDDKKGGDIDLFVITKENDNLYEKKLKLSSKLKMLLHKPVDVIFHKDFNRQIEQEALKGIVL